MNKLFKILVFILSSGNYSLGYGIYIKDSSLKFQDIMFHTTMRLCENNRKKFENMTIPISKAQTELVKK